MKKIILLFSLLLIITGCAVGPQFHVNVDSIGGIESHSKNKYLLLPGVKGVEESDLQYREYSSFVERALISIGYVKTGNFAEADIAIFLGYGIGDPQTHQFTYSLPTYGQTGISSSSTYGTVNTYGNKAIYSGKTTYTPTYGVTGSKTYVGNRTTYFRYMFLDAIDLEEYRKTEKEVQLWKTTATSVGASGDLRRVFPILVAASKSHMGTNTGKQVKVILSENDKAVIEVKGLNK